MKRRTFLEQTTLAAGGLMTLPLVYTPSFNAAKKRLVMVGTGHRGSDF